MRFLSCLTILVCLAPAGGMRAGERQGSTSPGQTLAGQGDIFRPVLLQEEPRPGPRPGRRWGPFLPPPLLERLKDLPPEEQEKVLRNNERFQQLPMERQDQLLERLRRFQELSPEQKARIEQRYENFRRLTPEQRQKAREIYRQHWRDLDPERRRALVQEFRRLREMSPHEREEYLDGSEFERRFNSDERELLKELSVLPVGRPRSRDR